jgi:hypothetical protein
MYVYTYTSILKKFDDDWGKNVTTRVSTRFFHIWIVWPSFWPQVTYIPTWPRNYQNKLSDQFQGYSDQEQDFKQSYDMLNRLDKAGCVNYVKHLLYQNRFGFVWIANKVGNQAFFLGTFKQRLKNCAYKNIFSEIENSTHAKNTCWLIFLVQVIHSW